MDNAKHIVFITNNNFAMPTGVAIFSLIKNKNPETVYDINILCDKVSKSNKTKLKKCEVENAIINLIDFDEQMVKGRIPHGWESPWPVTAYYKLFIAELFQNYDKVLYLDGDILVRKDLSDLYDIDIEGYYLAGVRNLMVRKTTKENIENMCMKHDFYFNSGVLLLNLKMFRRDDCLGRALSYAQYGNLSAVDQNIFNVICGARAMELPEKFNDLSMLYRLIKKEETQGLDPFMDVSVPFECQNVVINHFASLRKPWTYDLEYYTPLFMEYFAKSPFRDTPLHFKTKSVNENGKIRGTMLKYPLTRQLASFAKVYKVHGFRVAITVPIKKYLSPRIQKITKPSQEPILVRVLHYAPTYEAIGGWANQRNVYDYYPVYHNISFDGYIREVVNMNINPYGDDYFDTVIIELHDGSFISGDKGPIKSCLCNDTSVQDAFKENRHNEQLAKVETLFYKYNDGYVIDIKKLASELRRTLKRWGRAFFTISSWMKEESEDDNIARLSISVCELAEILKDYGFFIKHIISEDDLTDEEKNFVPEECFRNESFIAFKK